MVSSVLLALAGAVSVLFGVRYLLTKQFMPYHATVAGRRWEELEPGVRTIILGMLRIIGGALAAYGLALLWLLIPLRDGQAWAAWAALTLTAACVLPTLYVTVWLRRGAPSAATPIAPAAAVLAMAWIGAVLALVR
jgi:hypothetical protein